MYSQAYSKMHCICMTWYTSTCGIMAMGLLYRLCGQMCVLYLPWIQWLFYGQRKINGRSLQDGHH
jgi:hypothetical protein